jgi:hypothetical protein
VKGRQKQESRRKNKKKRKNMKNSRVISADK